MVVEHHHEALLAERMHHAVQHLQRTEALQLRVLSDAAWEASAAQHLVGERQAHLDPTAYSSTCIYVARYSLYIAPYCLYIARFCLYIAYMSCREKMNL